MGKFEISFVLIAYNQGRFIREAVQGALSQEGAPIEIILSDDASSDDTYWIMEEMVRTYNGPHAVRLNRNGENMGLVAHLQYAVSLSEGRWIITAAGDDISLPGRAAAVLRAAKDSEGSVAVGVGYQLMSESGIIDSSRTIHVTAGQLTGSPLEALVRLRSSGRKEVLTGAAMAWHRSVFEKFPPFPASRNLYEDVILQWRALLLGGTTYVLDPLVYYRCHSGSMTNWGRVSDPKAAQAKKAKLLESVKASWQAVRADYEHASRSGLIHPDQARLCCCEINRQIEYVDALLAWPCASLSMRILYFLRYFRYGIWRHVLPNLVNVVRRRT